MGCRFMRAIKKLTNSLVRANVEFIRVQVTDESSIYGITELRYVDEVLVGFRPCSFLKHGTKVFATDFQDGAVSMNRPTFDH